MNGLRSTVQRLGFYVAPSKYDEKPALYVMSKYGFMKVAAFTNLKKANIFLETLGAMFEDTTANWDLIGPCDNWDIRDVYVYGEETSD